MGSVLESAVGEPPVELPSICLDDHGLIRTGLQWGGSDHPSVVEWRGDSRLFFQGMTVRGSLLISRTSWDSFSSLKYLSYITEHKIAKKSLKRSNMTSIESSTCHLMFQQRLFFFSSLNLLKAGVIDEQCPPLCAS